MSQLARLRLKIERRRQEMYEAGPGDQLRVSQELDELINKYYRLNKPIFKKAV